MNPLLSVQNLQVAVADTAILHDVTLAMAPGELHVLMGPNGSGKSTFANALAGAPGLAVRGGTVQFAGRDLLALAADARARAGLLLCFQYPVSIPGLSLASLLTSALGVRQPAPAVPSATPSAGLASAGLEQQLPLLLSRLKLPVEIAQRDVNEGLSGGEKKKSEIAQLAVLKPQLAILDEPDSGLDVDSLKLIAQAIDALHRKGMAVLLITHYQRIVQYLRPDRVHVMVGGRVARSGGPELAEEIERTGYEPLTVANKESGIMN